jgi:hypothetical protein
MRKKSLANGIPQILKASFHSNCKGSLDGMLRDTNGAVSNSSRELLRILVTLCVRLKELDKIRILSVHFTKLTEHSRPNVDMRR